MGLRNTHVAMKEKLKRQESKAEKLFLKITDRLDDETAKLVADYGIARYGEGVYQTVLDRRGEGK